mmetsp:Transcript_23078/g.22483  ORF Transcript_23078/g.22483 Transcript_23078/m.22483 type:complete len:402 (+) Transcript_23078:261-1466(+)|eukprot:CAMPEP_0170548728 /NCGR_PEP_ID=MMETSP0211-20121228/6943_1 /TAXON_ID=311385 /ORGANISM="Pseudokeronopsis sp., Strain OXSARD2" /LENGTH=401 /DNA_ID=CAMNT_0010854353 /DNA_START=368 /DNA_END=1573 /DNA_ORIENTATION=+
MLGSALKGVENLEENSDLLDNVQVITQFEPNFLRLFMPCFDEPCFKAVFKLTTLLDYKYYSVISNTEGEESMTGEGQKKVEFQETPLMSTYLFAFAIGTFEYQERFTSSGVKMRTYTPKGMSHLTVDQLKIASDAIEVYEEYFGMPYPLKKLDMVSYMKHDFRAMENWGLISVKEGILEGLYDPQNPAPFIRNARTIAHEVSHMWFGNFVTMEWWNDIWLNEGFARFCEHHVLSIIRPEFNIWEGYLEEVYMVAQQRDMNIGSTHSVKFTIDNPDNLLDIFDTISYAKGSVICRMTRLMVGDEQLFRQCLKTYLSRYQWRNATTPDLLSVIDEVSGKNVSEVMIPWIEMKSYPAVLIERTGNNTYHLKQEVFSNHTQGYIYPIPIHYQSTSGLTGSFIFGT